MSKALILVLFLAAAACPSTLVGLADHVIISVDSSSGHDNATCLQSQGQPCQTLEYVQSRLKSVANESVVIEICGPVINLTKALYFNNFSDLSIKGSEDSLNKPEIFCNTSYSGLSFANVTRLSLSYIQLSNCGLKENSTIYDISTHKMIVELSALYMLNCRDVYITNTVVYMSDGTGISMLDTNGNVRIEHTNIVNSTLRSNSSDNDIMFGGSGLHIEFSYCTNGNNAYGYSNCTSSEHYSNANYTIYKCNFTRNEANATQRFIFLNDIGPMSSGGGLYIGFAANASYLDITLEDCNFHGNHAVKYCGGIKLEFYGTAHDNQVSLIRTTFSQNSGRKTGGGLDVTYMQFTNYTWLENNSIMVTSCSFIGNSAGERGGGVFIFSGKKSDQSAIIFTDCTWSHNWALYGAAVYIMQATWASVYQGRSQLISFSNCNFTSNLVIPQNPISTDNFEVLQNGAGAVYCIRMIIKFSKVIKFEDNDGTALYLSDSVAIFSEASRVVFYNNSGTNGGAVSLMGQSFLNPNGSSNFSFINNRARQFGGGLYFRGLANNDRQICFIFREESTQKSSFNFTNNIASSRQGDHIFVSSFTSCDRSCQLFRKIIFDCIGFFYFSKSPGCTTATLPITFALDHNDSNPFEVIPGFRTYIPTTDCQRCNGE